MKPHCMFIPVPHTHYAYHDCIYLFEIEIFCNIVNVLTVTFDQINTSK